jgi:hypothetical protein
MKRSLPRTPELWLLEIRLAIKDAREIDPFDRVIFRPPPDARLFHLAPHVCLEFRGRKLESREADRVTEVALEHFVANSDPQSGDHVVETKPLLAFARCYLIAHLALDLIDEEQVETILNYCEEHLEE